MKNIEQEYFDWIYRLVCKTKKSSWRKLLSRLHEEQFVYILDMDGNRAEDGMELRFRFAGEAQKNHRHEILVPLPTKPCSILEMMVALSIRCEEHIMDNPVVGDRTADWFWDMVQSLGLSRMDDSAFDIRFVDNVLQKFIKREYGPDGHGGLFVVENSQRDLRDAEIWYQMMWYLDGIV